ncbi:hypothetical protein GNI_142290 [Gregarina niphandrodes]|uniref:Uncharacterized protein n=1 Tax=Gregarina niphandrodes TaxID=110365 RepID=A0A023B060_GRENI|nr:hypothetical protein GNI_142290 [Gregarina niphandrodes]EZG44957.1 hypothetical protein GNI_142290 [Gregarina niphandrodes]|eukprot:XP_011132617.1 hypothetical protein GNI_142290 [Gregarina niphandrodes]
MCPRHYLTDEDSGLKAFVEVGEGKVVLNVRGARARTDYLKAVQKFVNKEMSADKEKKGQPAPGEDVGMPVAAVEKVVQSEGPDGANVLVAYRDAQEYPKVARVKYEARFEASGKLYRARLRHLEPELRAELEKQVVKQLKLGVIRPSKSEWAAATHF